MVFQKRPCERQFDQDQGHNGTNGQFVHAVWHYHWKKSSRLSEQRTFHAANPRGQLVRERNIESLLSIVCDVLAAVDGAVVVHLTSPPSPFPPAGWFVSIRCNV
jgi:hypothetical protein